MIYFIGAGPGDPELITVKGAKVLAQAQIIIYAGSLVNIDIVYELGRSDAVLHNSATMNLDEIIEVMKAADLEGKTVARLHTGDPSIYGAIQEQMDALTKLGISFEVIPGVSSVFAAAAAIPHELTLPGISQTVILTRLEGRTPVPDKEQLKSLAQHNCTMAIFLSINQIERVVEELAAGGYKSDTGVVVVERASWPDQRVIRGRLDNIVDLIKVSGITRQALILVGKVFSDDYQLSKLYDKNFSHGFRVSK
ncbi:MAG: precorrin-4 C(11)-methyltransferase [Peptococcaceae bacterium]|nr:precorrin-4 C(11)-methyltransferase [Peptococcaceae bacterium]